MPAIRPAATTPAAEGARLLMRVFDQSKSERKPFGDDDDRITIPPDGVLDRGEFPSAKFDMIDRLDVQNGRISQVELERALARLSQSEQEAVVQEAKSTIARGESLGKRFGGAFAAFAVGGLALAGGLVLGGPVGLAVAGLGALGVGGGFFTAIKTIFDGGKAAKRLFDHVEGALKNL